MTVETEAALHFRAAFNCLSTHPLHYAVNRGSGRPTFVVSGAFQMAKAPKLKQRGKMTECRFWSSRMSEELVQILQFKIILKINMTRELLAG